MALMIGRLLQVGNIGRFAMLTYCCMVVVRHKQVLSQILSCKMFQSSRQLSFYLKRIESNCLWGLPCTGTCKVWGFFFCGAAFLLETSSAEMFLQSGLFALPLHLAQHICTFYCQQLAFFIGGLCWRHKTTNSLGDFVRRQESSLSLDWPLSEGS